MEDHRPRNRVRPTELTEHDATAALGRIDARDADAGQGARHVYETLTWGEGPAMITRSRLQNWLWYEVPTKYLTDEPGHMGQLAADAAALFDELGLDGYAAVCRSAATASVHEAFERSDAAGFAAMGDASAKSGVEPPDLDDLAWGQLMGMQEATARTAVEVALEHALDDGTFSVGGRGWRARQQEVTARTLDADRPDQPGQSWRTSVLTERVGRWVDEPARRCEELARMRAAVANRLLHPIPPPADLTEWLAPLQWLLTELGDEQPLTQAGYLSPAFVRHVHATAPWVDEFASGVPRSETDSILLHRLRGFLTSMGAVRKQKRVLKRTALGVSLVGDPDATWAALCGGIAPDPWDHFVVEAAGMVLLDADDPVPAKLVQATVIGIAAEMGWRTSGDGGGDHPPSEMACSYALSDTWALFRLCGLLDEAGDWRAGYTWSLTPAGRATMLAVLRRSATGPRARPF